MYQILMNDFVIFPGLIYIKHELYNYHFMQST